MTSIIVQTLFHSLWQICAVTALLWASLQLVSDHNSRLRYSLALASLYAVPVLFIATFFSLSKPDAPVSTATHLSPAADYSTFIIWLWFIGAVVPISRLCKSAVGLRLLLNSPVQTTPGHLQLRFRALLEQIAISREVRLFLSENVKGACAAAYFRPVILLPPAYLTKLSIDEVEAIIAHELAHIKRHDGLHRILQALVETVFYYHPCLHWISKHVSIEREHACDDLASTLLSDRHHLATGLLKAKLVLADNALLLTAQSQSFSALETRVKRLISHSPARPPRAERVLISFILAIALVVIGAGAIMLPSSTKPAQIHGPKFSQAQLVSLKNDVCDHLGARELYWTPPYNLSGAATVHVTGDKVFMNGSELPAEDQTALKVVFERHKLSSFDEVRLRYYGDDVNLFVSHRDGENSVST